MKKEKISQVQERYLQLLVDGLDAVSAYRQATGNKKLSASSARTGVYRLSQNVAIMKRLAELQEKTETAKTLRRQDKRELLSDMVKKLVGKFNDTIDTVIIDEEETSKTAMARVSLLEVAGKLSSQVSKLISVDNQMSGDNAPQKVENDITSGGKELTTLKICIKDRINQLKAGKLELNS